MEILRQLSEHEVDELMELYRLKYGIENYHYILMYNQRKWDKCLSTVENADRTPDLWISFRKRFYTHRNGEFRKFGTYISLHFDLIQSISFHSWEDTHTELLECLRETALIKWTCGPLLTNVDIPVCEAVKSIALAKGARIGRARQCQFLVLEHDQALRLEPTKLPDGYRVRELLTSDSELAHTTWANSKEGSLQYIRGLIKFNRTLGIYQECDKTLVAWIFQNDFSGLGILQVLPIVQRKGLGSILATMLSKQIAESENVQLSAWIVNENFRSEALLGKIGYRKSAMAEWIQLN